MVNKYQSNLSKENWQAIKHILRYLQGTKHLKLCFDIGDLELIDYSNTDFRSDIDDRKSTSGQIFMLDGVTIFGLSKKQNCVAKSIMQ